MARGLQRAIHRGDLDRVDALVAAGADLSDVTDRERWTLLHRALLAVAMPPTEPMVRYLLARGLDAGAVDADGRTPLHYAARLRRPDLVGMLLEAGAPADVEDRDGLTPLRQVVLTQPVDVASVRLLVAAGADPGHRAGDGASVTELARLVTTDADVLAVLGTG